jgi:hypothetical protein
MYQGRFRITPKPIETLPPWGDHVGETPAVASHALTNTLQGSIEFPSRFLMIVRCQESFRLHLAASDVAGSLVDVTHNPT